MKSWVGEVKMAKVDPIPGTLSAIKAIPKRRARSKPCILPGVDQPLPQKSLGQFEQSNRKLV